MKLLKNFPFLKKISFTTIIIIFLFYAQVKCNGINAYNENSAYNKNIGDSCSSNLECNSACCSSKKCAKTSKCENLVKAVYIAEAALCLVFIIAFTIYLIIKLKKIKEDFQKKTSSPEEEQKKEN